LSKPTLRSQLWSKPLAPLASAKYSRSPNFWTVKTLPVAESVMLSLAGAIAGLALTYYALAALPLIVPKQIADTVSLADIRLGGPLAAATLALSIVMGFVVAALPALRALSAKSISGTLADTGRTKASASSRQALRSVLIVAEVALSVLLLLGAALMIRSMARLQGQTLGIDAGRVAIIQVTLPMNKFGPGKSQLFIDGVIARLKALPGVEAVGAANVLPLSGMGARRPFRRDTDSPDGPKPLADFRLATPDYFRAMGMKLVAGRAFTDADRGGAPEVVIINESLA
jgi:hypothetical protein